MNQPPVHKMKGKDEDGDVAGAPHSVVSPAVPSLGQPPAYCRICQLSNAGVYNMLSWIKSALSYYTIRGHE